jgi:hypothetical protein
MFLPEQIKLKAVAAALSAQFEPERAQMALVEAKID